MALRQLAHCAVRCLGRVASGQLTATGGALQSRLFPSYRRRCDALCQKSRELRGSEMTILKNVVDYVRSEREMRPNGATNQRPDIV